MNVLVWTVEFTLKKKKIRNKIQLLKEKANNGKFAEVFEWELRVFAIDLVNADKKITWQDGS